MHSNHVIAEIIRLLDERKLSQREISRLTGASRSTVQQVASGRRLPSDFEPEAEAGPIKRCPTCGGLVEMPCRLCSVRVLKYGLPADARA